MSQRNLGYPAAAISVLGLLLALYYGPLSDYLSRKTPQLIENSSDSYPTVHDDVQNATYIGIRQAEVEHFQNIFYAEDTSGKNRFAPPVKFTPSSGSVVDATKSGAWCPQGVGDVLPFTSRVENISEHCLSLRIARPRATERDAMLPVVVWIHGGGHALGSAYDTLYEPDGLVEQANTDGQPVVFVAINYRLGLFGFAASKALSAAGHTNVGLRDQRAALQWVQDNIKDFGGDSSRVTVIGQSVGASDIGLQLTSFGGKHGAPFSKAIMMSGAPGLNFNIESDLVINNTAFVAEQVNCIRHGDAQSDATLACLREAPVDELTKISVESSRAARPPFGEGFFYPTLDNDFIPDRPSRLTRAGKMVKNVPVMASWVTNDGAWYAPPPTATDEDVLGSFGLWLTGLSKPTKSRLLELYPLADFEHMVRPEIDGPISAQYYRAAQMNRDLWFTCPVLDFAWNHARNGGKGPGHTFLYQHNSTRYTPVFEMMGVPMWRVAHLSDIPFVFNNQNLLGPSSEVLDLSRVISRSIVKYAYSGSPVYGDGGIEDWPGAFESLSKKELEADNPKQLTLEVTGGPHGCTPVTVSTSSEGEGASDIQRAMYWEKLLERCEFINSEQIRDEIGV